MLTKIDLHGWMTNKIIPTIQWQLEKHLQHWMATKNHLHWYWMTSENLISIVGWQRNMISTVGW
jgi:hypothetical protein